MKESGILIVSPTLTGILRFTPGPASQLVTLPPGSSTVHLPHLH